MKNAKLSSDEILARLLALNLERAQSGGQGLRRMATWPTKTDGAVNASGTGEPERNDDRAYCR